MVQDLTGTNKPGENVGELPATSQKEWKCSHPICAFFQSLNGDFGPS